jgi:hypothetical protein
MTTAIHMAFGLSGRADHVSRKSGQNPVGSRALVRLIVLGQGDLAVALWTLMA